MKNALNWFEIPVTEIERAANFYKTILDEEIQVMDAMGMKTAFFAADMQAGAVGGCLMQGPGYEPSTSGSLIYLNAGEDLAVALAKVEEAGGTILLPKTAIGPHGFMAYFTDTEGNKVGLHSMK